MAHDDNDPGHGNSVAAWTAVIIMLVAVAVGTIAFWFDQPWIVLGSVVLLILGPIVGKILASAGYGVKAHD